jgi:hypothetical protein
MTTATNFFRALRGISARIPASVSLVACLALSLSLRLFRRAPEMLSSDAADLASSAAKLVCRSASLGEVANRLLLFRLGGIQPLVLFAQGWSSRLFSTAMNPTDWEWSTILVSVSCSGLAYLTGRRYANAHVGLSWGLLLAVSPIHIMLGRHLGAPWAYEVAFQAALLWLGDRHLCAPTRETAASFFLTLAAYFWCGNQMLAIMPVLAYLALAHVLEREARERIAYLFSVTVNPWVLAPFVSGLGLVYATFALKKGHLAHALFDKEKHLGWYWHNWYHDLVSDLGYGPTWIGFIAVGIGIVCKGPLVSRRRVPLFYFLCYTLPFLFWIDQRTTLTRGYVICGVSGLLLLIALLPYHLNILLQGNPKAPSAQRQSGLLTGGVLSVTTLLLLAGAGSSVYRLYAGTHLGVRGFQGSFGRPIGASAAAAFIRTHGGGLPGKVFSDASGGGGLEPSIMRLYFRRPSLSLYDAARKAPYLKFASAAATVDYAVALPKNRSLMAKYFPELHLRAKVYGGTTSEVKLLVYFRSKGRVARIRAEQGHAAYAAAFPTVCAD